MSTRAIRGCILHCLSDPGEHGDPAAVEYFDDGMMLIDNGRIVSIGPAQAVAATLGEDIPVTHYESELIMPGMIDCHVHFPQTDIIASYGAQLLDWLNTYTFPAEAKFADKALADETAAFFLDELLRNGTTSALVFATVHPQSADALFEAAAQRNMRIAAGKVLMDRHCPDYLQDTAVSGYRESRDLLERWHGNGRAHYAITPRFAPTSSPQQLAAAGKLAAEFPDTLVHTHLAENLDEVRWVAELFPEARSYLDVYARAQLLRERSVFAHCIHLDDADHHQMANAGAAMAFCPTSNLFLGSGLFDLARARAHEIRVGLGTDVGGGTSFSLLRTAGEAYKVLQLGKQSLPSFRALWLATLGGAEALYMDDRIGNFKPGKEADFIVVDCESTELLKRRHRATQTLDEALFVQLMLADDRAIAATYVMGEIAWTRLSEDD